MRNGKVAFFLALVAIAIFICVGLHREYSKPAVLTQLQSAETNALVSVSTRSVTRTSFNSGPLRMRPTDSEEVRAQIEYTKQEMTNMTLLWRTPLLYYGKVVDENNRPIPGVQVSYGGNSINESLTEELRNEGMVTTDGGGMFKIDGIRGIGLMFQLYHPDFYPYPDNPTGFDVRSPPRSGVVPDTETKAQVFRMHRKGRPVPLIYREGGFHAPNDGSIAYFPFRGQTRSEILGQLQIQGWVSDSVKGSPYNWRLRLGVQQGGIKEKTNYFDFIAPESGYSQSMDIAVSGTESVRKEYFLMLPAGYLRLKLRVIMGKDMFVFGEYYFNPDRSRNLELDPYRVIRPTR